MRPEEMQKLFESVSEELRSAIDRCPEISEKRKQSAYGILAVLDAEFKEVKTDQSAGDVQATIALIDLAFDQLEALVSGGVSVNEES